MLYGIMMILILGMVFPVGVFAQDQEPEDDPALLAATWLVGQQEENGSFSNGDLGVTVLALMALAAVDQPNPAAMTWLENYILDDPESLTLGTVSAALLAVTANGVDPEIFANGILPQAHEALISVISTEEVSQFDLCWGLTAAATLDREAPAAALAGLLLLQNEDGGFGATEDGSDPFLTALCLQGLVGAEEDNAVARVLDYFRATQREEGGWRALGEGEIDGFTTGFVLLGLQAAGENLTDWNDPIRTLMEFRDEQTGAFLHTIDETSADNETLNIGATAVAMMVLTRTTLLDVTEELVEVVINPQGEDGPALDRAWQSLAGGLQIAELDTADDFFITTMNPDTEEEMFGIQIINWAATNNFTRFLITDYLSADILLWMGHYDPAIWEQISDNVLRLLPNHVLILLPEQVQERIAPEATAEPTEEPEEAEDAAVEPVETEAP